MRLPFSGLGAWLAVSMTACAGPAPATFPGIGTSGGALAGSLRVRVVDERTGEPVAATIELGAATASYTTGFSTLTTSEPAPTVVVRADGFVTERWIGVDRDTVVVGLARPLAPRTLVGTITGGTADVVVSAPTSLSILRAREVVGTVAPCAGGACEVTLTPESRDAVLDAVVIDATSARVATELPIDAAGHFAVDLAGITESERLLALDVTIPSAPAGLEGVVGVPGIATDDGVALLPDPSAGAATMRAPAREGPMHGARLWYIVRAHTSDGAGESMIFDRDVGTDGAVTLPSTFLAVPAATASGTVGIEVDSEAALYVIEAEAGATGERTLLLHPSAGHVEVPVSLTGASRVTVRAIGADVGAGAIDLASVEQTATRIATLTL